MTENCQYYEDAKHKSGSDRILKLFEIGLLITGGIMESYLKYDEISIKKKRKIWTWLVNSRKNMRYGISEDGFAWYME